MVFKLGKNLSKKKMKVMYRCKSAHKWMLMALHITCPDISQGCYFCNINGLKLTELAFDVVNKLGLV